MHIEEKNISLSLFIPPVKRIKQISLGMPGRKASEFGFKFVRSTNAYLWPFRSYQPVIMDQLSRI